MVPQTRILALTLPVLLCSCNSWGQVQLYTRPQVATVASPSAVGGEIPRPLLPSAASVPTPGPLLLSDVLSQTVMPNNLRIISSHSDAVTVEWSLPDGVAAHQYTALLNGQPVQMGLVGHQYTFTGLNPQSVNTLELHSSFLNSGSTGSLPRPLKIVMSRPDALTVEWGGAALSTGAPYSALLNGQPLQNGVMAQQQTFRLDPKTSNTLELQTTTPIATLPILPLPSPPGPLSNPLSAALSFSPPGNLRVVLNRPDALTVEWDFADHTIPHSYQVFLNGVSMQKGVLANQYTFTGLTPQTAYTLEVQAESSQASSPKVAVQTMTLLQGQNASGNFAGGGSSSVSNSTSGVITTAAAPIITSFTPTSGGAGTVVVLTGRYFTGITGVTFNGVSVPSFVVNSDSQMTATLPTGVTSGNIVVTQAGGSATSSTAFTVLPPTIAGFAPPSGGSGTAVVITGTQFIGTTAVTFNGVAAASFVVNSATQITATTPTGVTSGNIAVTHAGGMATSAAAFTSLAGTANVGTLAGSTAGYSDGVGTAALFNGPIVASLDSANNIYVVEFNHRVRKIDTAGNVTTVAGSGVGGTADGVGTIAQFFLPAGIVVNSAGNLYVADYGNHRIRKIDTAGNVTTIAGGAQGTDDGVGTAGLFKNPSGIIQDSAGNLYVTDHGNHRIRKIDTAGNVTTIAGSPSAVSGYSDGAGTAALFNNPTIPVLDPAGNLYVTEQSNHRVRKIDTAGNVTTIAGSSTTGTADGVGTAAQFNGPTGLARDSAGNLYVVDTNTHRIRKISTAGTVTTVTGSTAGYSEGTLSSSLFSSPRGLAVDSSGNLYVMDFNNHRVRKIVIVP